MNAIKKIAAYTRHTCAVSSFSVNSYVGMGKLENGCDTVHSTPELLGPMRKNILEHAVNRPERTVFSRPEFYGFGRDGLVRKAGRMACSMFLTSRPSFARKNASDGFLSQHGAETMTNVTPTPTPKTAPSGIMPAKFPGSIERQIGIETALADALHFVRLPYSAKTLNAATGRARRALTLLKQACTEANTGGTA